MHCRSHFNLVSPDRGVLRLEDFKFHSCLGQMLSISFHMAGDLIFSCERNEQVVHTVRHTMRTRCAKYVVLFYDCIIFSGIAGCKYRSISISRACGGGGGGSGIENLRSPTSFGSDSECCDSESSWGL